MTQLQCSGKSKLEEDKAFLPVSLTKSIYHIIALWWHRHLTGCCETVVYSLLVSLRERSRPS